MAGALYSIREDLRTAAIGATSGGASALTLVAERVALGYSALAVTEKFLRDLLSDGPWLTIRGGSLADRDEQVGVASYTIIADLWIGIDKESDNDFTLIEKLLDAIKVKWTSRSIGWSDPELDVRHNPVTVHYEITIDAVGC